MDKLFSYAKFAIHPGKEVEFRALAEQCMNIVKEQEPGTLFYEWFINEVGTECVALDCYTGIDAMMEHVKHIGPLMRQLMAISDRYVEIYGADPFPVLAGRGTTKSSEYYGKRILGKL
ncbi:MAG: antibiotic biosynthesis monooxygenase [Steroidobacteraceae bacterium]